MILVAATAILYLGCFCFYQAGKRRAAFRRLKDSEGARRLVHIIGWVLAFAALFLLAEVYGWELGIPLWMGMFVIAGVTSLLVSALWPRLHVPSALASVLILAASSTVATIGGAI